ncbi:hypothetical protein [Salmonella enterica]|uniref:hypothetical protein n=1 Tax=Salmonella enterica TaxID=28901 RepID=UPI003AAA9C96|nr:hypothetical protein [Salmonella enterica subsp. enterica serovar Sangalkam]
MSHDIYEKKYFERSFRFVVIKPQELLALKNNAERKFDGVSIVDGDGASLNKFSLHDSFSESLRYLNLNRANYLNLDLISHMKNLEYINFLGGCAIEIPFDECVSLWCAYINYNKKTCRNIFALKKIKNLFVDNYKDKRSSDFECLTDIIRLGFTTFNMTDISFVGNMNSIEHIGLSYNSKLVTLNGLKDNKTIKSIGISNCRNISDWHVIESVRSVESLFIDNCGMIGTLGFLNSLPNLREVRITGGTEIQDGCIKTLIEKESIENFFIPHKSRYDVSAKDIATRAGPSVTDGE